MAENNLTIKDFRQIWTPFCFLDESGTLDQKSQPYFTVGMVKVSQPYFLQQKIRYIREKNQFWWEVKFNDLNKAKLPVALEILSALFATHSIHFSSYSIDKRSKYFKENYHSDPFFAYEQIAQELIKGNLRKNEVLTVLADNVVSPKRSRFEVNIKNRINNEFSRLAIAGVCRLDSRSNDLLQLTDLLVGSINYELLINEKLIPLPSQAKMYFKEQFKRNLGVSTLTSNFRNYGFNIHHHKPDGFLAKMKKAIGQ
ncbi:MAG: hypothetical protein A3E98_03065 [Candidatus Doudnabacteria bacterium RIFCSPHIGHO2_12_FULL_48_11]|uniref:DUF3800 domain-containing protein n=1 Tax=Candidatus Doudnabacteria bacterium RIFCSPHIGHO2_01_FULL_46_24 TaxID=1817825 RepID=A0A1F5NTI6_9BACT|nr:MAG: hypothetical protein A2720_03650 [Candidatus Doudnabacteria bacterium RIFCSPHIGHO2_01_FULL_46_24]OGE96020.1 MAG: hypothetical protein A3E98_03065 [Candidatus Doudnabacteria bacterium RIFCSPHIGHO2_12_FULL_48_11]